MVTYGGDLPRITNSAQELIAITNKIESTITTLENNAETTLAEWEGAVRDTYKQKKLEWDNAAKQMAAAAKRAGANLDHIGQEYVAMENNGVSMWQ